MLRRLSPLILVALLMAEGALAPTTDAAARPSVASPAPDATRQLERPPAPEGSHRPRFVHQSQNNCAFASAVMLVDKWTGGRRRPEQHKLRAASGVPTTEGVGIGELARAVQKSTNLRMLWSPGGGDPLTWDGLMARLAKGGAAVVAGSYSRLPAHYTRWSRAYAALGPSASGHAVYIERYEPGRRGGRVWMMDPLAVGSRYDGEWISAVDLKAFVWRTGKGLVHAMATPEPPSLAGYKFGSPVETEPGVALAGAKVAISIPLHVRAGWTRPDDLAVSVVWHPLSVEPDPDAVARAYLDDVAALRAEREAEEAAAAPAPSPRDGDAVSPGSAASAPDDDVSVAALETWRRARAAEAASAAGPDDEEATDAQAPGNERPRLPKATEPVLVPLTARGGALNAKLAAPDAAGTYRVSFAIRHRTGRQFEDPPAPPLDDLTISLRGPLQATLGGIQAPSEMTPGSVESVTVSVSNVGSADWRGDETMRVVAHWETGGRTWHAASAPAAVDSLERRKVALGVIAPTGTQRARLIVQLVRWDGVPMTEYGLTPVTTEIAFAAPEPAGAVDSPQE